MAGGGASTSDRPLSARDAGAARLGERVAYAIAAAVPLLLIYLREVTDAAAVAAALALILAAHRAGRLGDVVATARRAPSTPLGVAVLALLALLATSVAWSLAPERGAERVAHMVGVTVLAVGAVAAASVGTVRAGARAVGLALGLAAIVLIAEHHTGAYLRGVLGLRTEIHQLNRGAVAIALFLPLAVALLARDRRWLSAALLIVLCWVAVMRLTSESAKLALVVCAVVAPASLLAPRFTRGALAALVGLGMLLVPLAAGLVETYLPDVVHRIVGPSSIGIRAEIWSAFAHYAWERPLFGYGVEGAHGFVAAMPAGVLSEREAFLMSLSHPHNAPLQVLFELGLVGAVLSGVVIWLGVRAIPPMPRVMEAAALSSVAGFHAVAVVSHGAWQSWFYSLGVLLALLFVSTRGRNSRGGGPSDASAAFPLITDRARDTRTATASSPRKFRRP
ncbi:O-antigen ligase family protein [Salinarimonas chemoclinalis]|uniref:O-antigen ligase family protein n=1 Tax=Salinarimonas chemoclinalis TaxID=3241599 RepID=UPI003558C98A